MTWSESAAAAGTAFTWVEASVKRRQLVPPPPGREGTYPGREENMSRR